jgi:hypothetical protein
VVWQFWGRAAEDVLSLNAQGVFSCPEQFTGKVQPGKLFRAPASMQAPLLRSRWGIV